MKLYYSPGACSLASRIVAEEIGLKLAYEKVNLKTHKTEGGGDYFAINPKGAVPALALDDGGVLTENVALLPFLGDARPEARIVPACGTVERARLAEWLGFISTEIHKSFAPLFHDTDDKAKTEARRTLAKHFAFVGKKLTGRTFLLGDTFSVADAYLFVMLTWTDKTGVDLPHGELTAFRSRVAQRPTVKRALAAEGLA